MSKQCEKCGSDQIIPHAEVIDRSEGYRGDLEVVVTGDPHAMIFSDSEYGKLSARICGSCGYTELYVDNPFSLYRKYLQSRESS